MVAIIFFFFLFVFCFFHYTFLFLANTVHNKQTCTGGHYQIVRLLLLCQSRTQSPQAFWTARERPKRLFGGHYQIVSSDAPVLFKMPVDSGCEIDKAKEACKFATHWSSEPRASARGYFDDVSILSLFFVVRGFLVRGSFTLLLCWTDETCCNCCYCYGIIIVAAIADIIINFSMRSKTVILRFLWKWRPNQKKKERSQISHELVPLSKKKCLFD